MCVVVSCLPLAAGAQNFGNESMDFVYLDALHGYRDAMNDIIAWYPKVAV